MKIMRIALIAGLCAGFLGSATAVHAHAIIVDLAPGVPGFQTAITVLPGTPIVADIHLVDDGVTPITGYGLAANFNDVPGTLALAPPTIAGGGAAAAAVPVDLFGGGAVAPGVPLVPGAIPPFGIGPAGPFTATDAGAGYYDVAGFAWPGMPGLGGTIVLETVMFVAAGPVGSITDIAPLGILAPGAPGGPALPPVVGAGGVEFYDAAVGTYGAVPFAPGANPLFPGGLPATMPGTVAIIPEPSGVMLGAMSSALFLLRRRRNQGA